MQLVLQLSQSHPPSSSAFIYSHASASQSELAAAFAPTGITQFSWLLHSGASFHMTFDATLLHSYQPIFPDLHVIIADGMTLLIASCGSLHTSHFHILDVAHIPKLSMNLISVSQLTSRGYLVIFYELLCYVC